MVRHPLIITLLLFLFLLCLVVSPTLALTDKDILLQSKAQLIGFCPTCPPTDCLPTWNANNSLNDFEGITTTAGTSSSSPLRVEKINVSSSVARPLCGTLPSSWSSLSSVTSIALTGSYRITLCFLTGPLPPSWALLNRTLSYVNLTYNAFAGSLPEEWAALVKMTHLDLSHNGFTGSLPEEWSALVKMMHFDVYFNQLSGPLPSSYSNWTSLKHFDVGVNRKLSGFLPPSFKKWKMLNYFDVSNNRLSGKLPPEYSTWENVTSFSVRNNNFFSELPESYGAWKKMTNFYCGENQLSGQLPESYQSFASLHHLDISNNRFTGSLPPGYSSWVNIRKFIASATGLSGPLPESYGSWSQLNFLDVSANQLTGELPPAYKNWTQIKYFASQNNRFTGCLPPSWSSWVNIETFFASSAGLSGPLPESYGSWSQLGYFFVNLNHLTEELPPAYNNWTQIRNFVVNSNQLTGTLPWEYSAWTEISTFIISSNQLVGELPSSYSNWNQTLTTFQVNGNFFNGSVPSSYESLSQMTVFDASNNKLSGSISSEFGISWQSSLQKFLISGNRFSGELPDSLSNLKQLTQLDVSNNLLHGAVSSELCRLDQLIVADFSQNCLELSNETIQCFTALPKLIALQYAPSCFSLLPTVTTAPLASSYSYNVANKQGTTVSACQGFIDNTDGNLFYCSSESPAQLRFVSTVNGNGKVFQFGVFCENFEYGLPGIVSFRTACYALLFRPLLQCFLDIEATIPCSTNPIIDYPQPSYHNKTVLADVSFTTNEYTLDVSNSKYIYGVYFRIFSVASLNFAVNYTVFGIPGPLDYPLNTTTPMFQASPCQLQSSVAIQYSTDCTVCPDLALCDGTTSIHVSNQKAAWRYSPDLLPLYECDLKATQGCLKSNSTNNFDGSSCKDHFTGFLCARCESDYAMADGECSQCPSKGSIIGIFCACIVALLIIATLLVYVSLDSVKKEKEEIDHEEECCDCSALEQKLQRYRPQLEKLTVIVRMLINHFTLLGALASTSAANQATDSLKTLLKFQNGGGGGALLGAYSGTLSCLFANDNQTSSSVLNFNILWIVFASVFVFESIFFFAFTRKLTSTAAVALFLSFIAFSPLAEYSSKLLALCKPFDFYNTRDYLRYGTNANLNQTFSYLSTDLAQECDDDFQNSARVGAALTISLFCGLLPVIIAFAYKKIQSADDRAAIFSFMTEDYKKEAWYYELIVMVRKLLIALAISIFVEQGDLQLQLFTLVTTMMLGASLTIQPLQSKIANIVDQVSISSALVCATFLSVISGFADDEGVAIASTVLIFITQVVAILAIVLFSHRSEEKKNSSSSELYREQEVGYLNAPLFSANKDSELATEHDEDEERHLSYYWKRKAEDAEKARIESENTRMQVEADFKKLRHEMNKKEEIQTKLENEIRLLRQQLGESRAT